MKNINLYFQKNVFLVVFGLILTSLTFAQTYTLNSASNNTTVTTCAGTFVDQGGTGGNYSANSSLTITFCSGSSSRVRLDFSVFNIESGFDIMTFYDGATTASPLLGTSSGNIGANTIQSSGSCLTIKFTSNATTQAVGWQGVLSCNQPCITPVSIGTITNQPSPVKICPGETVNFDGSASTVGTGFSIVNYTWDFDDGTTATGATSSHVFNNPGEYIVQLNIKDNNGGGCLNTNRIDLVVKVSTNPTFVGTTPNQTVCSGTSTCLTGVINPTTWTDLPPTNIFGTLALPDGSGICYEQAITFVEFSPGQTVTSAAQILNVNANLEHSWAGDISITIICPNGQQVGVFNSDGTWNTTSVSSENFGNQAVTPPTGYDYVWTSTGSTIEAWGAANPSNTTNTAIPAGTYGSEQPFTGLVGCPLNGTWKLKICDLWSSDAGTVFSWGINFAPSVYASLSSFTPVFNSNCTGTYWTGINAASTAAITSTSSDCNQICVTPPSAGTYTYKYSVVDDFGCTYDTTITITATAGSVTVNAGLDQSICTGSTATLVASGTATTYTWNNGITNNTPFTPPLGTTTYTLTGTVASGCSNTDQVTITVNPRPTVTVNSPSTCTGTATTITATPGVAGTYNYAWTVPAGFTNPGNVASFPSSVAGTYSVVITNPTTNCSSTSASGTLSVAGLTATVNSPSACSGTAAAVTVTPSTTGTFSYVWTVPAGATNPGNVATFNTTTAGTYSVIVTNTVNGCSSSSASGIVSANPIPTVTVNSPSTCSGTATTITATPGSVGTYSYAWTVPAGFTNPGNVANFNSSTAGTYSVVITNTTTGCISTSASGTLTINPLSATVNSPTICSGSPATVTATPSTTGTFSYVWTVPGGATNPGDVATFNTTTAGTYSVVVTNTVTGCSSSSASGTATINSIPTVTVNSPTVCTGATATLTATPGSVATYSYAWTVPAGATAPGNSATVSTTIAGTYSVIITNTTTGCISASSNGVVTLSSIPAVTVNSPSTCTGITTAITATPTVAGTYNYAWTVPAGVPAPGNVSTFNSSTAGNYSVIITDPVTTCSSLSASGTLTINALPTVTVNNPSICSGNNATVVATPGTAGTYSYAWTVPAGASDPGSVANFTTTTAGSYSVIITNTTTGCVSSSASGTATINPNPTVLVNSPSICAGQSTTVTATPSPAATYSYAWTVPAGATAPGNIATFSTTIAGTYSVVITNTTTGCVSSSASGVATVNPIPTVSVNSSTICAATTANVTATPVGGGTYIYTWTVPAGFTNPGNVATFTTSTNGNYSVVVTDQATLCSSVSGSGNVTVVNLPTATISGTTTICSGVPAVVTFSGTPNAMVSYTVNSGAAQTVTLNAQGSATVSTGVLTSNATYTLTGVAITTSPFCSQILNSSVTITVENAPVITFTSDVTSGCAPLRVNFTNTTLNSMNCNWNFGNGSTASGCGTVTHTFNSAGCYDIRLTASSANGCVSNLTIPSMICVEAVPVAAFNPTPDVVSSLNSECTMLNISTGAVSYEWELGDASTSTDFEPVHTYTLDEGIDHYTIKLIAYSQSGCSDTAFVTIKVYEELVYFIPNTFTPDGDKFNQTFQPVFTKGYDPYSFNMIIVNRWGETVFESNDAKVGWDGTYGGKIVQEGTYTWKINFKVKSDDEKKMQTGHVVLIR